LFDQARLKAGQTVVIHGAAGNVGAYAVQLARRAGMRSIATAATDDIPFVRSLGANTVIDYRTQRFEEEVRNADAVIDLVGGETQKRSFQVLRRGGKLISAVSGPDQHPSHSHYHPSYGAYGAMMGIASERDFIGRSVTCTSYGMFWSTHRKIAWQSAISTSLIWFY
jgi:NADPH:quinone reductase-like Zn-dependent oxidoreductase